MLHVGFSLKGLAQLVKVVEKIVLKIAGLREKC